MRSTKRIFLAALVLGLVVSASGSASVIEQTPADAMAVIRIGNLQETNARLVKWARQFGMNQQPWDDPIGWAMRQARLGAGINRNAEAAIVQFAPAKDSFMPQTVMLIPVSDHAAFVKGFGQSRKEGDIDVVRLPRVPLPGYIAAWGTYAAVAMDPQLLSRKPGGFKPDARTGKLLADKANDIVIYANVKVMREHVLPWIKAQMEQGMKQAQAMLPQGGGNPLIGPLMQTLAAQQTKVLQEVFEDATSLALALGIGDAGLSMTMVAEFSPDRPLGSVAAALENTQGSLLAGLPDASFILFGGARQQFDLADKFFSGMVDPLARQLMAGGAGEKALAEAMAAYKEGMKHVEGSAFGLVLDPFGQGGVVKSVTLMQGDSKAMGQALAKVRSAVDKAQSQPSTRPGKQAMTFTPAAKRVGDVALDRTVAQFKPDLNSPSEAMASQMLAILTGASGPTIYSGAVDARHMLQIMGEDEAMITKAVEAAKAGADALGSSARVKTVAANLPRNRFAEMYVAVDRIATAIIGLHNVHGGGNLQAQFPPDTPPVGMALSSDGPSVRLDAIVPAQLIDAIVKAYLQIRLQVLQGGGKPGDL